MSQDPNDEPASVLLEKIKAEKERLVKEGKQKLPTKFAPTDRNMSPCNLPKNWISTRFGEVIILISGQHILLSDYNENSVGIGYLTGPSDFGTIFPTIKKWTEKPKVISKKNDILLTVKGAGLGKSNIVDMSEIAISRQLMAIRCIIVDFNYVHIFIKTKYDDFQKGGTGIAIPGLSRGFVQGLIFNIPPIAEQKRIVAKVDELMALCDELEKGLSRSQTDSNRLTETCVAGIMAA